MIEEMIKIYKINRENGLELYPVSKSTELDEFIVKRPLSQTDFTMVWEYHLIRKGYHCIVSINEKHEPTPERVKELRVKTNNIIVKEFMKDLKNESSLKIKRLNAIIDNIKECKKIYDIERIMGLVLNKDLRNNKFLKHLIKQEDINTVKGELIGHYLEELKNDYSYDYHSKTRIIIYRE